MTTRAQRDQWNKDIQTIRDGAGTIATVGRCVEFIDEIQRDYEVAHSCEDELRRAVLTTVANGDPASVSLARAALETDAMDFGRHCA